MSRVSLGLGEHLSPRPAVSSGGGAAVPVMLSAPTGFAFTGPYQPNLYRSGAGTTSVFTTDYNEAARKALITPAQTIYVRLSTGNNNNDGLTTGTAIRSLDLAVAMANAYGTATKINYEAAALGATRLKYRRVNTQARSAGTVNGVNLNATYNDAWSTTAVPTNDIIFEPSVANGVADSMLDAALGAHTATADANIYTATPQSSIVMVDYTNLDTYGAPIRLVPLLTTPANTTAPWPEMNALWTLYSGLPKRGGGTYATGVVYNNGTNSYVRTWDNRNPNGDANLIPLSAASASIQLRANTAGGANRRYYIEGLGFAGGANGALYVTGDNGFRVRLDAVRCRFLGGAGPGALSMTSALSGATSGVDVVAVACAANGGTKDGFNAHFACSLVTIDCIGDWNGYDSTTFNNGITAHETTALIDVNGSYRNAQDRPVHHVHDCLTWHLGTEAGTRRGADATEMSTDFAVNGGGNTGSAKMWIDAPRFFDGPAGAPQYRFAAYPSSTMFYANSSITPSGNPGAGSFAAYTP